MLFKNKNNFEKTTETTENGYYYVPNSIPDFSGNENEQKHSKKTQLLMFLIGFAYFGFIIINFIVALFFINIQDEMLNLFLVDSVSYLFLVLILVGLASREKEAFKNLFNVKAAILFGLVGGVIIYFGQIIIQAFISIFYEFNVNSNQDTVVNLVTNYPTIMFIVICLIGPICEELTYRVGLYGLLERKNKNVALIVSSIVFALIHVDFISGVFLDELFAFPSYLFGGLVLAYVYEKKGFTASLIAHALANTISAILILII